MTDGTLVGVRRERSVSAPAKPGRLPPRAKRDGRSSRGARRPSIRATLPARGQRDVHRQRRAVRRHLHNDNNLTSTLRRRKQVFHRFLRRAFSRRCPLRFVRPGNAPRVHERKRRRFHVATGGDYTTRSDRPGRYRVTPRHARHAREKHDMSTADSARRRQRSASVGTTPRPRPEQTPTRRTHGLAKADGGIRTHNPGFTKAVLYR